MLIMLIFAAHKYGKIMVNPSWLKNFVEESFKEDVGPGDYTSLACIDPDSRSTAKLLVKDVGIIAGVELAEYILKTVDSEVGFIKHKQDGDDVGMGDIVFETEAHTQSLLKAERLILNCMQRMSGIATQSNRFATEVEGLPVKILDTRKTTPLIRPLEKWAVAIGGCTNYRDGLYDWIMIKDNHIKACGGVKQAIDQIRKYLQDHNLNLGITVEVRNLVELHEVIERGDITRIMLDNFELAILREAVATIDGKFETEASGGVNLYTVRNIAETGVNFISVGAITHSAGVLDLSLKIFDQE